MQFRPIYCWSFNSQVWIFRLLSQSLLLKLLITDSKSLLEIKILLISNTLFLHLIFNLLLSFQTLVLAVHLSIKVDNFEVIAVSNFMKIVVFREVDILFAFISKSEGRLFEDTFGLTKFRNISIIVGKLVNICDTHRPILQINLLSVPRYSLKLLFDS